MDLGKEAGQLICYHGPGSGGRSSYQHGFRSEGRSAYILSWTWVRSHVSFSTIMDLGKEAGQLICYHGTGSGGRSAIMYLGQKAGQLTVSTIMYSTWVRRQVSLQYLLSCNWVRRQVSLQYLLSFTVPGSGKRQVSLSAIMDLGQEAGQHGS
jgi:hypothetical protein